MQYLPESSPANSSPYSDHQRESQVRGHSRLFDSVFARGIGGVLVDVDGRRSIDFLSGHGSLNYGHNDPDMLKALVEHLQHHGLSAGLDLHSSAKQRFVKAFCGLVLAPRGMSHRLQFTGPGVDDGLAAALALARKVTGRTGVITFSHSHTGAASGPLAGALRYPYDGVGAAGSGGLELLGRLLGDPGSGVVPPAAIVLECVQTESSLRAASGRWVRQLAALARRHGALLVIDDRIAGGGRCGGFFSFEGLGVMPDLVLPTQSIAGLGLPMGLLLVRPDRDRWAPAELSSPFQHNHHAFVAAAVACEKFWTDGQLQRTVAQRASLLIAGLQGVAALLPPPAHPADVRIVGRGLLQGLRLPDAAMAREVVMACFRRGLVLGTAPADDALLRLMPPLTAPTLLLEQGLAILYRCVAEVTGQKARSAPHRALAAVHAAARARAASARTADG